MPVSTVVFLTDATKYFTWNAGSKTQCLGCKRRYYLNATMFIETKSYTYYSFVCYICYLLKLTSMEAMN